MMSGLRGQVHLQQRSFVRDGRQVPTRAWDPGVQELHDLRKTVHHEHATGHEAAQHRMQQAPHRVL